MPRRRPPPRPRPPPPPRTTPSPRSGGAARLPSGRSPRPTAPANNTTTINTISWPATGAFRWPPSSPPGRAPSRAPEGPPGEDPEGPAKSPVSKSLASSNFAGERSDVRGRFILGMRRADWLSFFQISYFRFHERLQETPGKQGRQSGRRVRRRGFYGERARRTSVFPRTMVKKCS